MLCKEIQHFDVKACLSAAARLSSYIETCVHTETNKVTIAYHSRVPTFRGMPKHIAICAMFLTSLRITRESNLGIRNKLAFAILTLR